MTATPNPLIVADFSTSLAAGVSVGATTATLQSATDADGVALASGTYAFAVDTNSSSKKEYFIASLSGTSLTSVQSVSRQGALSSGFARAHRIGATVILTDHASLRIVSDLLRGSGTLNPSTPLSYDSHPTFTSDTQIIDKKYADDLAISGSPDASTAVKGIAKMSVSPASATAPIAVGDNDPRVPTQDENDALVGSSGTPSSSNKYITADDVSSSGGANKVIRANGSALPALSGAAVTDVVITIPSVLTVSDSVLASTDTETTTTNTAYTLMREFVINFPGNVRITYDTYISNSIRTVDVEIRRFDGTAVASSSHNGTSYTTQTHSLTTYLNAGERLSIYMKQGGGSGYTCYIRNCRIKGSLTTNAVAIAI